MGGLVSAGACCRIVISAEDGVRNMSTPNRTPSDLQAGIEQAASLN